MTNPLRADPTRTRMLRRAFVAEFRRRFRRLGTELNQTLLRHQASPEGTRSSASWLRMLLELRLLVPAWWRPFLERAYLRGATSAYTAMRLTLPEAAGGGREEFLRLLRSGLYVGYLTTNDATATPGSQERLDLLSLRLENEVQGLADSLARELARVLLDVVSGSLSREDAVNRARPLLSANLVRAEAIANTEVTRAHAEGQLDAAQLLGASGVTASVEWSTAGDGKVCPLCRPLQGVVLTLAEARGMLPRHPRCRCSWRLITGKRFGGGLAYSADREGAGVAATTTTLRDRRRDSREAQRAISRSQKAQGKRGLRWGPAVPISRRAASRPRG